MLLRTSPIRPSSTRAPSWTPTRRLPSPRRSLPTSQTTQPIQLIQSMSPTRQTLTRRTYPPLRRRTSTTLTTRTTSRPTTIPPAADAVSDDSVQEASEAEPSEADLAGADESAGAGAESSVASDYEAAPEPEQRPSHVPAARLGQAHVPGDVVPTRSEPFLPTRRPDHPEPAPTHLTGLPSAMPHAPAASSSGAPTGQATGSGGTVGNTAVATDPAAAALIERDPSVNRSLLLRLIAGVRGL